MRSIYVTAIALSAMLTVQSCAKKEAVKEELHGEVIPVQTIALQKQDISAVISTSGQFTTDDETMLSFKTGGIIQEIYVKEGDAVRKGQLLATLNPTEINAQVQQAQLAYEKAQRDNQRVSNLYRDSVATLEQLQNSKTALDFAKQQLVAAEFNLQHSEIRANSNGYILRRLASEGQMAGPGTPVFMTNGAGDGNWVLRVVVSDKEWAGLQLNDKAVLETDAAPGKKFEAEVSRRSEGIDPVTGSFTIDLQLKEKTSAIAAGMFGKAIITPSRTSNSWSIPYEALLEGNGNKGYVFVTSDNKTAKKVEVTVESITKDKAIISSGLESAGSLIVTGSAYLTDKSAIKVINNPYTAQK